MSHRARKERYYGRGHGALQKAVEADERRESERARFFYEQACEFYLSGLAFDSDRASRRKVISRVQGYLSRAEALAGIAGKVQESVSEEEHGASEDFNARGRARGRRRGWEGVAGLKEVKRALTEAVLMPMRFPKAFQGARKPWKGVLLYGPPGTGKSHIAAALSREADCTFLSISASDIMSKHQGESERAVKRLFQEAREKRPTVIFLDEIDSIGGSRDDEQHEASRRVLTEVLRQMDGVGTDTEGITFIGATNHPEFLDAALRRRFEKRIYVPMPGPKARSRILRIHIGRNKALACVSKEELNELARSLPGFSGSDLANVANEALMLPVRRCLKATHFKYVSLPDSSKQKKQIEHQTTGFLGGLWGMLMGSFQEGEAVLVPCHPWEPEAIKMNMMDPKFPSEELRVPPITMQDLEEALQKVKPSVDQKTLKIYADFAASFGSNIPSFEDNDEAGEDEDETEDEKDNEREQEEEMTSSSSTNSFDPRLEPA